MNRSCSRVWQDIRRCAFAAVCVLHWLARHSADALLFCADALEILRRRLQTARRFR